MLQTALEVIKTPDKLKAELLISADSFQLCNAHFDTIHCGVYFRKQLKRHGKASKHRPINQMEVCTHVALNNRGVSQYCGVLMTLNSCAALSPSSLVQLIFKS